MVKNIYRSSSSSAILKFCATRYLTNHCYISGGISKGMYPLKIVLYDSEAILPASVAHGLGMRLTYYTYTRNDIMHWVEGSIASLGVCFILLHICIS